MRYPGPADLITNWDWQIDAACRSLDGDLFFHPHRERKRHRDHRVVQAKAICATCPVIRLCQEHALTAVEPYGIWGGLSEEERATILGVRTLADAARVRELRVLHPDEPTRVG